MEININEKNTEGSRKKRNSELQKHIKGVVRKVCCHTLHGDTAKETTVKVIER